MQRIAPNQDVLVSQHKTREKAQDAIDKALPGDQPEMRIEEKEAT